MDGQKPLETNGETPAPLAPGATVQPQSQPAQAAAPQVSAETTQLQEVAEADSGQTVPPYEQETVDFNSEEAVSWTASEFIAHHKTSGWYILLWLAVAAASVLIWFLTKDVISSAVVVIAGGLLATYASHKPRQITYQIDPSGLTIGQRHYDFNEFRSFSVVPEGAFSSIVFMPLKRFGTLTTIYYDPQDEEQIIDVISQRLPHEEPRRDMVDSMMRRIRF